MIKSTLPLPHSRLIPLYANRDIREHPHPAFRSFDALDLPLHGRLRGDELFSS